MRAMERVERSPSLDQPKSRLLPVVPRLLRSSRMPVGVESALLGLDVSTARVATVKFRRPDRYSPRWG